MACKKALEKASGAAWELNTLQKGGGVEEVASEGASQETSANVVPTFCSASISLSLLSIVLVERK